MWLWWTLGSVGYLANGIIGMNVITWTDKPNKDPDSDDVWVTGVVMLFWPLAFVAFISWGLFWLAFRPYRRGLAEERKTKQAKAIREAEERQQQELADAERIIGLPAALRVGNHNDNKRIDQVSARRRSTDRSRR